MKQHIVKYIVIALSLSLVSMVVLQVYWIKSAYKSKEGEFESSVIHVGEAVTEGLSKLEKEYNRAARAHIIELSQKADSLNGLIYSGLHGMYYYNIDQKGDDIVISDTVVFDSEKERAAFNDAINKPENRSLIELRRFYLDEMASDPWLLIETLGGELPDIDISKNIEDRIKQNWVDSLLYSELIDEHLKIKYSYSVYDPDRNLVVFSKACDCHENAFGSPYRFRIYPNSIANSEVLILHFPEETNYLIKNIWSLLTLSLLIIGVIVTSVMFILGQLLKQRKLSVLKNDFINNMTHEFKTPVSTISLACESALDPNMAIGRDQVNYYLKIIAEENNRLRVIAESILQSASVEEVKMKLIKEEFDIYDIISGAVEKVRIHVELNEGVITTSYCSDSQMIVGDKMHITNVMFNLLDNANKYSDGKPEIKVSTSMEDKYIRISVKDNGIGIAKSNHSKIFDKLYRVPTGDVHDVKGFGLGLAYVRSIVEMHHGKIEVESELKKGTIFHLLLPLP